jgi:Tfp pilus assembly protein PilX
MNRSPSAQRGITLITALIMLVLLTMMAITAFHIGSSQSVIVSNSQHRDEATDAAQQMIDTVLNSSIATAPVPREQPTTYASTSMATAPRTSRWRSRRSRSALRVGTSTTAAWT